MKFPNPQALEQGNISQLNQLMEEAQVKYYLDHASRSQKVRYYVQQALFWMLALMMVMLHIGMMMLSITHLI